MQERYNHLNSKIDEIIALPSTIKGKDQESKLFIEAIKENLVNDILPFITNNWIDTAAKGNQKNWQHENYIAFLERVNLKNPKILECLALLRVKCNELKGIACEIGSGYKEASQGKTYQDTPQHQALQIKLTGLQESFNRELEDKQNTPTVTPDSTTVYLSDSADSPTAKNSSFSRKEDARRTSSEQGLSSSSPIRA